MCYSVTSAGLVFSITAGVPPKTRDVLVSTQTVLKKNHCEQLHNKSPLCSTALGPAAAGFKCEMRTEDRWNPEWLLCGSLAADYSPTGDPRWVELFPAMSNFWQLFQLCHGLPSPPLPRLNTSIYLCLSSHQSQARIKIEQKLHRGVQSAADSCRSSVFINMTDSGSHSEIRRTGCWF